MTTALLCETRDRPNRWPSSRWRATTRDHGDMVELRLDGVTRLDVAGALRRSACARQSSRAAPTWEGGRFDGTEEERPRAFCTALRGWRGATWTSNGAPRSRTATTSTCAVTAADRRCRRDDFDGVPERSHGSRASDARRWRRIDQGGRGASALSETLALRDIGAGGERGRDRHGRGGCAVTAAGRALWIGEWTFAGARCRAGSDSGGDDGRRLSASVASARRRGSSAS